MTVSVNIDWRSGQTSYGRSIDASDKGAILRPLFADADFVRLTSYTTIADVDVVAASREINAGRSSLIDTDLLARIASPGLD